MNKILLVLICCSAFNAAQAQTSNLFEESFEGMFDVPVEPIEVPTGVQGPLNPAVPLDGGLTALLVAGGAVGYRKYRACSKNN
jgi:hypothetical protein